MSPSSLLLSLLLALIPAEAPSATPAGGVPDATGGVLDATDGVPDATRGATTVGSSLASGSRGDTLRTLVERALEAERAGRPVAAAEAYLGAVGLDPRAEPWLRLSALQRLAEAGELGRARAVADELEERAVVWPDSVRAALLRAAVAGEREEEALTLARELAPEAVPVTWTRHVVPALLDRGGPGDRAVAARGLRAVLGAPGAPREAAPALLELGGGWSDLRRAGRSDLREGRGSRGRRLLAEALAAAPEAASPRIGLELAEARLDAGRLSALRRDVPPLLESSATDDSARAALALLLGRAELRRNAGSRAEAAFRLAVSAGPARPAAFAAFLLGDLARDRGEIETARRRYRRAASEFGSFEHGGLARVRLAFLDYRDGRHREAAGHFRRYRGGLPDGPWAQASLYWEARAREAVGDARGADSLFRRAMNRDPLSWYGVRAAERRGLSLPRALGVSAGEARGGSAREAGRPSARRASAVDSGVDSLLGEMGLLRELGWRGRALRVLEVRRREERPSGPAALELALRLGEDGWSSEGIRIGWELFARRGGAWSQPLLRAVFPLPYRGELLRAARREGLEPALLAAVVRQESRLDPRAVSPRGAVGLAQLMPATARQVARRIGLPPPRPEELTTPGLNLLLGAAYLSRLLRRFDGSRVGALVAYNAGPERYRRWRRLPEHGADRELFIDRIPAGETRRYVKAVLRNERLYGWLHGL